MRPLQPGLTLRSYRLEHLLGFGASGQVWLARDTRDREVALKARKREGGGDEQRFRQEFEKLRTLRLPGVVRVLDTGADEGYIFFTMDVARGEPFDTWVQAGDDLAARVQRAAQAGAQVARALAAIHRLGLAHRDIKPANILINKNCQVMICDFGLARTMPESSIGKGSGNTKRVRDSIIKQCLKEDCTKEKVKKIIANKLDQSKKQEQGVPSRCMSSHVGTRWYRAPEITILENRYDTASDMWSFGCCIYELMKVIDHPATNVLGHPTGRILQGREGYEVDLFAVLEHMAEHNDEGRMKAIELNASPYRLDLDWRLCKHAKGLGVPVAINPDAHSIRGLSDIAYGVMTARKGWIEPKNTLNSLDGEALATLMARGR